MRKVWTGLVFMAVAGVSRGHPGGHWDFPGVSPVRDPGFQMASLALVGLALGALWIFWRMRVQRAGGVGNKAFLLLFASLMMTLGACAQRPAKPKGPKPGALSHFEPFKEQLDLDWDGEYLLVGSKGFPDHPMMVGITNWQQQVPLPQPFRGKNAWRIPLEPRPAAKPLSTKNNLMRGAIAVAVNGVPIFNALNNRGEDAYLIGELDEYGGHCGKGDDYHYHIAPLHLEKVVGKGKPIAYALDGYPVMGQKDADGLVPTDLDACHGRVDADGQYRYYSSTRYPYTIGAMRGVVRVRGDGIEPQPKDSPGRPPGRPLPGAKITGFERDDKNRTYTLSYSREGGEYRIRYTLEGEKAVRFTYTGPDGKSTQEEYRRR